MSIRYKWQCKNCGLVVLKHLQPHEWWGGAGADGIRGCPCYDWNEPHEWVNLGEE